MRFDAVRSTTMVVALALAAACGGGSEKKEQFTCDVQTVSVNTCTVAMVDSSKAAAFQSTCTSLGGNVTTDPCSRPNPFGICNDEKGDGFTANVTAYPSSTITTQAGAQTACDNEGGTWVANAGFSSGYNCASSAYCGQFGALTSTQQATANQYCEQYGLPDVTMGTCSSSLVIGTCAISNVSLGDVTIYFYGSAADAGSDQATCEATFNGTWTTAS